MSDVRKFKMCWLIFITKCKFEFISISIFNLLLFVLCLPKKLSNFKIKKHLSQKTHTKNSLIFALLWKILMLIVQSFSVLWNFCSLRFDVWCQINQNVLTHHHKQMRIWIFFSISIFKFATFCALVTKILSDLSKIKKTLKPKTQNKIIFSFIITQKLDAQRTIFSVLWNFHSLRCLMSDKSKCADSSSQTYVNLNFVFNFNYNFQFFSFFEL